MITSSFVLNKNNCHFSQLLIKNNLVELINKNELELLQETKTER